MSRRPWLRPVTLNERGVIVPPYNESDEYFPGNRYGRVEARFYSGGHHSFELTPRENDLIQRAWIGGREGAREVHPYEPWMWNRYAREAEQRERYRIRRRRARHMLLAELVALRHGGPGIASHILRRYRPRD